MLIIGVLEACLVATSVIEHLLYLPLYDNKAINP
jgi:hypothetical protein